MAPITTIVHFKVPAENVDRFFAFWQDSIKDVTGSQPGLIDGIFQRAIDAEGPCQFINVARWESAEHLQAALETTVKTASRRRRDARKVPGTRRQGLPEQLRRSSALRG